MLGVQDSVPVEEESDFSAKINQMLLQLIGSNLFLEYQVALDLHFEHALLLLCEVSQ